jgi:hypothetical protein
MTHRRPPSSWPELVFIAACLLCLVLLAVLWAVRG